MSLFVADLINQIRQQFGTQKTIITPKSLEYANKIVAGYNEENWDAFGEHMTDGKSHDDNLIDKVDNNMHTSGLENLGGSLQAWTWDDDGNLYKLPIEKQTMDSMKNSIYETILAMMFDDAYSGWGHAQTFIGYGVYNFGKTSVGVDFDKFGYSHFELASAYNQNGFDSNPYTLPSTSELTSQLNQAKSDLEKSKANLAQTNNDLSETQNVLVNATSTQANAKQALNTAQTDLANKRTVLNNAKKSVADAQNKLASDKQVQQQAQINLQAVTADLADLKTQLATNQENLTKALANLAQAKSGLDQANKDLASSKEKLVSKQTSLASAKSALAEAQAKLTELQQAPQTLAKAKETLDQANKNLEIAKENVEKAQQAYDEAKSNNDVAQKDLEDAKNSLAQVQEKQSQAQSAYDKAMKAYNDYLKAQQAVKDAEEKAKAQAQAKAEHTYFAQTANGKVVDEKGHIMVGYSVKGNQVFDAQSKLVGTLAQTSTTRRMVNTVKQENAKTLPQTGDKQNNNTTVGAILVGLGSLLGLGALGKRKED